MRHTAPQSVYSLWQQWMAVNPNDPRLEGKGLVLARIARQGFPKFERYVRKQMERAEGSAS